MKRRLVVVKPQSRPNADINVTPLVDVVLVLLIIFMVLTPLLEKELQLSLPATERIEAVDRLPPDQLVVRLDADGEILLDGVRMEPSRYVSELRSKLASRADKTVFVVADDRASYAKLVDCLDGAKAAGATRLGMAADPLDER